MIGDVITIRPEYYATAREILLCIEAQTPLHSFQKYVILIAGESGSGKSVTAVCLAEALQSIGKTQILS